MTGLLTGTTINATTLQQGGTALNTIISNNLSSYLTATQTSNQFLLLSGGALTGNVGIGTTSINGALTAYSTTSNLPRITLTGTEFYTPYSNSTNGIALMLGVNRSNNRQMWMADTSLLAINATNPTLRFLIGPNSGIDSIATDGLTRLNMAIGNNTNFLANGNVGIGTNNTAAALDIAYMNYTLMRNGGAGTYGISNQLLFSWNGNSNLNSHYHAINTRHSITTNYLNSIDFFIWQVGSATNQINTTQATLSITQPSVFVNVPYAYNYNLQGYGQSLTISGTGTGNWGQMYIYDKVATSTNYVGLLIKADNANSNCSLQSGKQGIGNLPLLLNPSGGNIGIGTGTTNAILELYSNAQLMPRIILSGQEFYLPYDSGLQNNQSSGIALLCGVNRIGNKQLWIGDSANLTQNTTNKILRLSPAGIDCTATNGTTLLPIYFGNLSAQTSIYGSYIYLNAYSGIDTSGNLTINGTINNSSVTSTSFDLTNGNQKFLAGGTLMLGSSSWQANSYTNLSQSGDASGANIYNRLLFNMYFPTPNSGLYIPNSGYSASIGIGTTPDTNYGIVTDRSIRVAGNTITSSDIRIKTNIIDIDDDIALSNILSIKPKKYEYIDKIKGSNIVYGFIAQQINEIIPEAINIENGYIPNIYTNCTFTSNIIYLENANNYDILLNDNLQIIANEKTDYYKIINITNSNIEFDREINNYSYNNCYSSNCFIYGKEVNDFHTLNKDYIFTLNVCATQDLYKIIQQQQEQINKLEIQINDIYNKLNN